MTKQKHEDATFKKDIRMKIVDIKIVNFVIRRIGDVLCFFWIIPSFWFLEIMLLPDKLGIPVVLGHIVLMALAIIQLEFGYAFAYTIYNAILPFFFVFWGLAMVSFMGAAFFGIFKR